ncbi:MAG: RIP metalloprotease RseP [Myxococcaceae bacterium]
MMPIQKFGFFLLFLGALVFVHEFGHFIVAKLCGVKVLKFSIGFGPRIFGFKRGDTEYRVSWIPLGGYVKMAGEQPFEELSPEEAKRGFLAQPPWKRGLIVLAGPAFNLIFPIIAYFFVFVGSHQAISTRVGSVEPGLPAAMAGIEPGDRIVKVDGEEVRTFDELRSSLQNLYDREIPVVVERNQTQIVTKLTPRKTVESNPIEKVTRGMIGISPAVRPPVIGVPLGSPAEKAGLKTFDRVLSVNGQPVKDELALKAALDKAQGTLELQVARHLPVVLPGASLQKAETVKVTLEKQQGSLYAALGAERGDLYVASVAPGSPAEAAGVKAGDRLLELNGQPISSFLILHYALREIEDKPFSLTWRSDSQVKTQELRQAKVEVDDELKQTSEVLDLGVRSHPGFPEAAEPEMVTIHMNPAQAFVASAKIVPEIIGQTVVVIGKLFTGGVPFKSVGGPIMLYEIAAKSAERGLDSYLTAMAILSINLGLMNLLPIPVLDGFHLLAAAWEGIRRRPIPVRAREVANMVGLALLMVLMVMVMKNDITRLLR